jgi:hypothetical protein
MPETDSQLGCLNYLVTPEFSYFIFFHTFTPLLNQNRKKAF